LGLTFLCSPVSAYWWRFDKTYRTTQKFKCGDLNPWIVFPGVMNLVSDVGLTVLPTTFVWKLQMPRKQKIALGGLFGVGLL
jgi:hypothetical protein